MLEVVEQVGMADMEKVHEPNYNDGNSGSEVGGG